MHGNVVLTLSVYETCFKILMFVNLKRVIKCIFSCHKLDQLEDRPHQRHLGARQSQLFWKSAKRKKVIQ